ncbi:MAG: alpha/beta hydrolase [Cyanobacteria bacterium P01_G01_bin.54]
MLAFQPAGFTQATLNTPLGSMVYSCPDDCFWPSLGGDRPPILFLHSLGGGSSAYEWSQVFPAFAATHRVIAPDLIGWGDSAHPVRSYTPQDYLEQICWLLEEVADEPAWVVSSSLTAALTIRLANQAPHLFQGLFLVSPSGYRDFGEGYDRQLAGQIIGLPLVDRLIYAVGAANELAVRNFLEQFLFAQTSRLNTDVVAAYLASATQPNAEYAALASLKGDICFDLAPYMGELTVPTVLVWGANSRFKTPKQGQRLAALNPAIIQAFQVIPDTGVLPHLERPAIVTGLLARYCSVAK